MKPRPIAILTLILSAASVVIFAPFVASLVLAAWAAHLARPLFTRLNRGLKGRERAAGVVTSLLVLAMVAPVVLAVTTMVPAARSLLVKLREAGGGKDALAALVSDGNGGGDTSKAIFDMVKEHGATASKALLVAAGASVDMLVSVLVFLVVLFALLVDGERAYRWLEEHLPIDRDAFARISRAFYQAGRGLLLGTGLTALVQGVLATIIYLALGVPRALLLGLLSTIAAVIPTTGATIVWIPVAIGFAVTGHGGKAALLSVLCLVVVGTADNVMRPWLSKRADVGLPTAVLLVSMFGGMAMLGAWGLVLGPLVVRLAAEALEIFRERRSADPIDAAAPSSDDRAVRDRDSAPRVIDRTGPPSRVPSTRGA